MQCSLGHNTHAMTKKLATRYCATKKYGSSLFLDLDHGLVVPDTSLLKVVLL